MAYRGRERKAARRDWAHPTDTEGSRHRACGQRHGARCFAGTHQSLTRGGRYRSGHSLPQETAMTNQLVALANGREMGSVIYRNARLSFTYEDSWKQDQGSYPLSLSMPLAAGEHGHAKIEAFLRSEERRVGKECRS